MEAQGAEDEEDVPEVLEEAMEGKMSSGRSPLLGWSVAEEDCNDRDAQQV